MGWFVGLANVLGCEGHLFCWLFIMSVYVAIVSYSNSEESYNVALGSYSGSIDACARVIVSCSGVMISCTDAITAYCDTMIYCTGSKTSYIYAKRSCSEVTFLFKIHFLCNTFSKKKFVNARIVLYVFR